ncbi:MAG: hydrogenase expression/formation protein HypE [Alphaproteobacteria bacterium CG_4_10_14_0_2_um_filter_63_37]|nr:MAG: hydrogenase expression/formation protein HypE [Proteobacteria bacterium CG1_02_64_396]PJA24229.1 MAG: hydrogenase expression/formation protein HypE [Alphaproteobacteria bacterium CG_4_10_14_0_2_um_filter_63_37]
MPHLDWTHGRIEMNHGGGGRAMAQLIDELFAAVFADAELDRRGDFAHLDLPPGRVVMATDAHVVSPRFFPGGDIGGLSIHGTVNDVAMSGGRPLFIAATFVLEEGLPLVELKQIVESMGHAAREAGVRIVAGDTKVVERGGCDGIFITTTGIGVVPEGIGVGVDRIQVGDAVLISGSIGDHGAAIMSTRENLSFATDLTSDTQSLNDLIAAMTTAVPTLRCLRDPTRGGLATVLNEFAASAKVGIRIEENQIPVKEPVVAACELLGLDPLYVACEGRLVAVCPADEAQTLLAAMRAHPKGEQAAIIGSVVEDPRHFVQMTTAFGGTRIVDMLTGEQLPRIC